MNYKINNIYNEDSYEAIKKYLIKVLIAFILMSPIYIVQQVKILQEKVQYQKEFQRYKTKNLLI